MLRQMTEEKAELKPEDVKVGTKEEALWDRVKSEAKALIIQRENELIIQKAILALAERKIKEEQRKAKNRNI